MNNLNLIVCHDGVRTLDLKSTGLFRNKGWGFIVLATGEREGIVVKESGTRYPTGFESKSWVKFTDEEIWEKLPIGSSVTYIQTEGIVNE